MRSSRHRKNSRGVTVIEYSGVTKENKNNEGCIAAKQSGSGRFPVGPRELKVGSDDDEKPSGEMGVHWVVVSMRVAAGRRATHG